MINLRVAVNKKVGYVFKDVGKTEGADIVFRTMRGHFPFKLLRQGPIKVLSEGCSCVPMHFGDINIQVPASRVRYYKYRIEGIPKAIVCVALVRKYNGKYYCLEPTLSMLRNGCSTKKMTRLMLFYSFDLRK